MEKNSQKPGNMLLMNEYLTPRWIIDCIAIEADVGKFNPLDSSISWGKS